MIGYVTALLTAVCFGSYIVPFKKVQSPNVALFQFPMAVGVFLFALILSPILHFPLTLNLYGILGGVLWASGNAFSFVAIDEIGVAVGAPIWVSMSVFVAYFTGILVFQETVHHPVFGLVDIILICVGVIIVSTAGATVLRKSRKGIIVSILAGFCLASYLLPLKFAHLTPSQYFFPMAVGILGLSFGYAIAMRVNFSTLAMGKSLFAGAIWSLGNLLSIITVLLLGISKGQPLTQLGLLVAVLWGLFYFREIKSKKDMRQILVGAIVLVSGVILLGLA